MPISRLHLAMAAFACAAWRFGPVIHVPDSRLNFPMKFPSLRTWQCKGGWSALYIVILNPRTVHSATLPSQAGDYHMITKCGPRTSSNTTEASPSTATARREVIGNGEPRRAWGPAQGLRGLDFVDK